MTHAALLLPTTAIAGFSQSTRDEILSYVAAQVGATHEVGPDAVGGQAASGWQDGVDDLTPLGANQITKFMKNVSDRTREILRGWSETSDGVLTMRDAKRIGAYDTWQQTRGFASGLTKRVRTVTGDDDAEFYGWRGAEDADEGAFFIHPTTHQSLRRFFGI